jgi:predicted XRE-type DNA-binding protein
MQNFTPYEVFKTLGLHRKTDKTKFGITPWSAKNNLQIRDILIEELRQHISHS